MSCDSKFVQFIFNFNFETFVYLFLSIYLNQNIKFKTKNYATHLLQRDSIKVRLALKTYAWDKTYAN